MADQEGNGRHESKRAINSKLPHLIHCLPISSAQPWAKANGRERPSRDNGPIQKRKKPPCPFVLQHPAIYSLCRAAAFRRTQIVRPVLQQRPSDPAAAPCCTSPAPCCFPRGQAAAQSHQAGIRSHWPRSKGRPPAMRRRAPAQVHISHRVGQPIGRGEALAAPVWEQIASTTRDALQILQHGNGLHRQRTDMVTPRFHLRRRPTPQRILKVELIPLGIRRFPGRQAVSAISRRHSEVSG